MLCNMYEARTVETIATSLVKVNQRNLFILNGNTYSEDTRVHRSLDLNEPIVLDP